MFIELEHIPIEFFKNHWIVVEVKNKLFIDLNIEEYQELKENFKYIKTKNIAPNLRRLLNVNNKFVWENESWEILNKDTFEKIKILTNKVEFIYDLLPSDININHTDDFVWEGERFVYIEKSSFEHLKNTYIWVDLSLIPINHREKGTIKTNRNIIILKKNLLPTIFRKLNRQG